MLRQFTETVGRHPQGKVADYPLDTWNKIAESAGRKLDSITIGVMPKQPAASAPKKRAKASRSNH